MKKAFIAIFILFSISFNSFGDAELTKNLNLITTLNKLYFPKAISYVQEELKNGSLIPKEKKILKEILQIANVCLISNDALKIHSKTLVEKYDIFRHCLTCKGIGSTKQRKRCLKCKSKGKCTRCGGDGVITKSVGRNIVKQFCDSCFRSKGVCSTCNGEKYENVPCKKCSITGGSIDPIKTKNVLIKLVKSYHVASSERDAFFQKVFSNSNTVKKKGQIEFSLPKVRSYSGEYRGFFIRQNNKLNIIFKLIDVHDPFKFKCIVNDKEIKYDQIKYSGKYDCFMLRLDTEVEGAKEVHFAKYNGISPAHVMVSEKGRKTYQEIKTGNDLSHNHEVKGLAIVQKGKVCGILGLERVVNRKNCQDIWFEKLSPYNLVTNTTFIGHDFLSDFKLLEKGSLESDMLYISQYLDFEKEFLKELLSKNISIKDQLDLEYLKELKDSFKSNNWKTVWAKHASKKLIKTISLLEKVKL